LEAAKRELPRLLADPSQPARAFDDFATGLTGKDLILTGAS
jgi:hypothetical protein